MGVREARPAEATTVRSVLDAAMLEVDGGTFERATVLVAVEEGPVLGALVLDGDEIDAVAVRPNRRGQGVGTALVAAAASRRDGTLVAEFDPGVRPFYESLGFEVDCGESGERCRGRLESLREA